jgi:LmbE family N-acetylglucosaminyl deacetylase
MNGTLLGVWAHPDDEAYLSAGLMAEFRRRGDRVVVVTATLGEHGTSDPVAWPPRRLAELRRVELHNSLAALGVDEIRLLGFEDGDCASHDATATIADHIVDVDPDLIVTFGPDGMTGHPDHRAVSRWTTDAWRTAESGADLWYATLTPEFHRQWGPTNDRIGLWGDQPEPPCTERADLARQFELPDDLLEMKLAALRAHASQTTPLIDLVGPDVYRAWWRAESFRPAALRKSADILDRCWPSRSMVPSSAVPAAS